MVQNEKTATVITVADVTTNITFLVGLVTHSKCVITECDCLSVQHICSHALETRTANQSTIIGIDIDACSVNEQKVSTIYTMQFVTQTQNKLKIQIVQQKSLQKQSTLS